ncbi:MAG TPA: carbohydrate ABC transporter permease [Firmicutes bacterium]|nr:carbohydrate ABC transporter permease [Bacillota bacterium]
MKRRISELPKYLVNVLLFVWLAFTFLVGFWLVMSSFKTTREIFRSVWSLPTSWSLDNYVRVLTDFGLLRYLINSLGVVFLATLLVQILATPVAYILGRLRFRFSSFITMAFIAGIAIPVQTIYIPLYLIMNKLKMVDTYRGIVWLYAITSVPFAVYLLIGFFKTIPTTLEDAALIDGASPWQAFFRIMLPVARPGIISSSIYIFIMTWKEFELALVFLSRDEKKTISLGLYSLISRLTYTGDWSGLFAGVILVVIPSVIFYILVARHFIAGITAGIGKS